MTTPGAELSPVHLLFALIGAALHLFVGIMVFASTLVAPLWAVVLLGTVWLAAGLWAARSWRTAKFAPLVAAVAVGVTWVIAINVGDALLDWNA